jgi:hypothetical protein
VLAIKYNVLTCHAAMQHSHNDELLQLWPAPTCKVGRPLCSQLVITEWKDVLTSIKYTSLRKLLVRC